MNNKQKWAWDRQWRTAILSTCAQHLDPETGAALTQGWMLFFSGLPFKARIVDVGTGNGIIPLLALNVSEQGNKGFDIHGTDIAAINPVQSVPDQAEHLAKITFHSETPTEKLPFKDSSVDALTSQHAIEYGDMEKSVQEVLRVLKPAGRVRLLMHASEGVLVASNVPKIKQCQYVLEQEKLFEKTRKAVEQGFEGKEDAGDDLKVALEKAGDTFKNDTNTKDLMELLGLLWGAYEKRAHFPDLKSFHDWLEENRKETLAQLMRIEAMRDAALSEGEVKEFVERLNKTGFAGAKYSSVHSASDSHLLGWLVEAKKQV